MAADEVVYRMIQGEGIQLTEDASTKTVEISVPGLGGKLNVGDIGQASHIQAGIVELATGAEVQLGSDDTLAVTPASLAAAAQSTTMDATVGRLMRVGAFGLGGSIVTATDVNLNADRVGGFYYSVGWLNGPAGIASGWLINIDQAGAGFACQHLTTVDTARHFFRVNYNGVWTAWKELYHTANFDPNTKANTSGTYPGLTSGNSGLVGGQAAEQLSPPGMICHFAGASTPPGWLYANGQAVARATYPLLFTAIGTRYGAGNGSSTFNVPDMRGVFARGYDDGRAIDSGRVFGSLQGSQNISHAHGASIGGGGGHGHSASATDAGEHVHAPIFLAGSSDDNGDPGSLVLTSSLQGNGQRQISSSQTGSGGAHGHTISVSAVGDHGHSVGIGSDGGAEARPINVALLPCIKF